MADTFAKELNRCANEAHRLLDSSVAPDGKARLLLLSAARALADASGPGIEETSTPTVPAVNPEDHLWNLTLAVTALRGQSDELRSIDEAVAALQLASTTLSGGAAIIPARIQRLREIEVGGTQRIRPQRNGPYIVTNAVSITDWLGQQLIVPPIVALCRCGGSTIKPFCDGTHIKNAFEDGKDPKRVADRRDAYDGQQLTVLDNRGTCAHSGFCTDRLPSVFHQGEEPFVSASGARFDEIVQVVRQCPSGALSFAVNGREAREQVDVARAPEISVSRDGPYRVTGSIPLEAQDDAAIARNVGASTEHYSLCRCGHSQNKPFCSGMHWSVRFTDPVIESKHDWTLFEWAGGLPALTRMTRLFYSKYVPEDPVIGPLFAKMAPDHPERVAAWLGEVFGGPKNYSERYGGYPRMLGQHAGKAITEAQRERWVTLLRRSADEAGLPRDAEWRAAFVAYLEWGSRLALENSQPGAKPPLHMPMPRWWWVCDATPGSRVSALASALDEPEPALPDPAERVTFEAHIRPLFRQKDRQSMRFAFDLWAYSDVVKHAAEVLRRVENGSMPCDGPWPSERVEVLRRWVDSGMPE
jgi:CDGSH-type Zn-finger protein/truncated hemoglobin YjbI